MRAATLAAAGLWLQAASFSLPRNRPLLRSHSSSKDDDDFHVVYSTGCTAFQQWQSEALLLSAKQVGQRGKITHIVVGCEDTDTTHGESTHQAGDADRVVSPEVWKREERFPGVSVYMVPATQKAKQFPWFNKPWSFNHWITNQPPKESIVAIVDPDQFFMRPLDNRPKSMSQILKPVTAESPGGFWWLPSEKVAGKWDHAGVNVVTEGQPVSQMYMLGPKMAEIFDSKTVCGEGSPCASLDKDVAKDYYQIGPPYIMHRNDFMKMIPKYWDMMQELFKRATDKRDLLIDMYAYNFANAHFNLRHTTLRNYMVSDKNCKQAEAWEWVNEIPSMSCHHPVFPADDESLRLPTFFHAASTYAASMPEPYDQREWSFHKGRVATAAIYSCDHPLILPPPDHFFNVMPKDSEQRLQAFGICLLTYHTNRVALAYRERFCKAGYNDQRCIVMVDEAHRPDCAVTPDGRNDPFCYPLAKDVCKSGQLQDYQFHGMSKKGKGGAKGSSWLTGLGHGHAEV